MFQTQDPYVFGLILFIGGLALMIAETVVPAFGALGLAGTIAAATGIFMLKDYMDVGMLVVMMLSALGILIALATVSLRAQRRPKTTGVDELLQATGDIVSWHGGKGRVRVTGEIWQATAADPAHVFKPGDKVRITQVDGLTLHITPLHP